ncbi:hypothetical protein SAMN02990966_04651 [Rhodospirillales bacterium URHD0017]|nr:hypothetical protein SAMN02990966_04651 [Rhodospirillales bacterium URHD0017]
MAADLDVIVQLRMSPNALVILTTVLLEAEMKFELDGRGNYADLMSLVLDQLPSLADITMH